jgi:hypothetical protein
MVKLTGEPLYPRRIADTLAYDLTQGDVSEQRLYDETTEYLQHVYNRAKFLNQSAARLATACFSVDWPAPPMRCYVLSNAGSRN